MENFADRDIFLQPKWYRTQSEAVAAVPPRFHRHYASTMCDLESSIYLTEEDRSVLQRRLALDEYEEWSIIASHYVFRQLSFKKMTQ